MPSSRYIISNGFTSDSLVYTESVGNPFDLIDLDDSRDESTRLTKSFENVFS